MAQLPLYYKNGKPVGSPSKRWKENYLFLLVFVAFVVLLTGNLWFVPNVDESTTEYGRSYDKFNPSGVHVATMNVAPSEPSLAPSQLGKGDKQPSYHVDRELQQTLEDPDARLKEGLKEGLNPKLGIVGVVDNGNGHNDNGVDPGQQEGPNPKLGIPVQGQYPNEGYENRNGDKGEDPKSPDEQLKSSPSSSTQAPSPSPMEAADHVPEQRRREIVELARRAWNDYVQNAWGDNELKPVSHKGHSPVIFGKTQLGATIVDSLDTLYLMGLKEEFEKAKEWVQLSLDFDRVPAKCEVSVFEVNIRYIGGLLSAYSLSKDEIFKEKAVEIVEKLLPAFNTATGIPKSLINLKTNAIKNWGWASGGSSVLAEFGSLHLEFQYLTYLTGNPVYLEKVQHIRAKLQSLSKPDGLYPNFFNPTTGRWGTRHVSIGALGDSFYEYLLKSWLMTSKDDTEARDMYYDAINALEKHIFKKTSTGLTYINDLRNGRPDGKMQHLACFSGGMLALGAQNAINGQTEHYMELAKEIANTCHYSYQNTATKLGPEAFRFDASGRMSSRTNEKMYLLRPETVETYFVLWRLTHDQKYRDWGWEAVEALKQHCLTPSGGFSGVKDVYNAAAPKDDVMQSFFIAETLKYLFLLYSDDSVLPLDQWVLNTEAHPFPLIPGVPKIEKKEGDV